MIRKFYKKNFLGKALLFIEKPNDCPALYNRNKNLSDFMFGQFDISNLLNSLTISCAWPLHLDVK